MGTGGKILLVVLGGGTLGLAIYSAITARNLTRMDYNVSGFKVVEIDNRFIHLDIRIDVINPADWDVVIKKYNLDVFLNDTWVANSQSATKKKIASNDTSRLTISISIDYKKIFGLLGSAKMLALFGAGDVDNIYLGIKGSFSGKLLGYEVISPIDEKLTLREITAAASKSTV
ncbi:MAG: hypothetical protein COA79_20365 [Planctomycetota bacterium]|nr:MAG: hypothetical protein COA79_20365 [Planctomycetota bacterium]